MALTISTTSLEYVLIPVYARSSGSIVDPTSDPVKIAAVARGSTPVVGDFGAASWDTDATTSPPTYYARCLVGVGGTITLSAGDYDVYVKITDSPEVPVKLSGQITVF